MISCTGNPLERLSFEKIGNPGCPEETGPPREMSPAVQPCCHLEVITAMVQEGLAWLCLDWTAGCGFLPMVLVYQDAGCRRVRVIEVWVKVLEERL